MTYKRLTRWLAMLSWICEEAIHSIPEQGSKMIKVDAETKKRVRRYAVAMFDQAVEKCRSHYRLPTGWNPKFSVRFSGSCSYATEEGVSILVQLGDDGTYAGRYFDAPEYHHIADDPEIGSFMTRDWRMVVRSLIAHELAHNVDLTMDPSLPYRRANKSNFDGFHGTKWQQRYRWITLNAWKDGVRIQTKRTL